MKEYIFDYIAEVLLEFFAQAEITPGERFHIRYEKSGQVAEQYEVIPAVAKTLDYAIEPFEFNGYESYSVCFPAFKLIVAASSSEVAVDFLTGLRNRTADNSEYAFEGAAILFIHNTSLDSLIGGCKSLAEAGMPLNVQAIRESIRQKIAVTDSFRSHEKHLLNYRLDQVGEGFSDDYSLFNYATFLQILGKKKLEQTDYHKLGLFRDKSLATEPAGELNKRLRKNEEWFREINDGHQYGGLDKKLEKDFSQKGVDRLQKDDWAEEDLGELIRWENEKNATKNIEYRPNITGFNPDNLVLWDKPSGETLAKSRVRHLVIFNYDHREKVMLDLLFDARPKKDGLGNKLNLAENEYQISGNYIKFTCQLPEPTQLVYKYLAYEHPGFSARYQFHLLIVPFREHLIASLKPFFLLKTEKKNWYLELAPGGPLLLNEGKATRLSGVIAAGADFELREDQTLELQPALAGAEPEQDDLVFSLHYQKQSIPVHIPLEIDKPQYASGAFIRAEKIAKKDSFKYNSWADPTTGKLVMNITRGSNKYYASNDFRENLAFEDQLIREGGLSYYQTDKTTMIVNPDYIVQDELKAAYEKLVGYYRAKNLLPSLAYLDEGLAAVSREYVHTYCRLIADLQENMPLSPLDVNLLRLGVVEMQYGPRLLKFSPLHPLNIAYQLQLREDLDGQQLLSYLLERLRPLNLVPYIRGRKRPSSDEHYFYQPLEQEHSPEWLYYFFDEVSSQQVSRHFVDKLVEQKIQQFLKHFQYLFINPQAVLRINLFNQGDTREVLQGIFKYYAGFLRRDNLDGDNAVPIEVRIYGSEQYMTKFEELSLCEDVRLIKDAYQFELPQVQVPADLLELYGRKVTFFKVDNVNFYEYAHLSFYQFSAEDIERSANDMREVPSGISLNGLLADVPSINQQGAFRTGFGLEGVDPTKNQLLGLTAGMNAFTNVTHTSHQYQAALTTAFVVKNRVSTTVEQVYAKSQWVTFIEPKVNLSFFEANEDVVIIHYSDQYNNASGYDAITVTTKWEPYKTAIAEIFSDQHITVREPDIIAIINLFNTLNGEWLLGLNTPLKINNPYYRIEKLSMLSAVKAALSVLDHANITWIPVSMEEILRISGAIGLPKDSLFSVKNLGEEGAHSDDLLLIGLEERGEELLFYLYPWEVKIGQVDAGVMSKAKDQSFKSASLLRKRLMDTQTLAGRLFRNFFAKLALINAEKCALYNIWPSYRQKWLRVAKLRSRLLHDDFLVSTALDRQVGYFGVIAFKASSEFFSRSIQYENDGCIITLLRHNALDYLSRPLEQLHEELGNGDIEGILPAKLLRSRYRQDNDGDELLDDGEPEMSAVMPNDGWQYLAETTPAAISAATTAGIPPQAEQPVTAEAPQTELRFNRLNAAEIARISQSIYEKLSAIRVEIKKEMPQDVNFVEGPAFYRIELKPEPETTIKKIKGAAEELNIALHLPEEASVRIFSDHGKIWLEAPKPDDKKVIVTTADIWPLFRKDSSFSVPFGTDIEGRVQSVNFSSANSPHLLLAGTTGSGKSVVLDTLIRGAMEFYDPEELQIFLIDPKGNELIDFEGKAHLPKPNGMTSDEAIGLLTEGVAEMDLRYNLFKNIRHQAGRAAKDLIDYNTMVSKPEERLPRWLVILDEYSDLLDENAANKSIIETLLKRLAQKARAAGIHVIIATQKPLATIISSAIKSNLPGVIALKVRTGTDSRVILDDSGAETLAGRGDSLFKNGSGQMVRVQCAIYQR